MTLKIQLQSITPRRYVGVRRTVKHDGIGRACGELLPRTARWLEEKAITPDGPPRVVYHSHNSETGEFEIRGAARSGVGASGHTSVSQRFESNSPVSSSSRPKS